MKIYVHLLDGVWDGSNRRTFRRDFIDWFYSQTAAYKVDSGPRAVEMMTWEAPVDMTGTVTFR